MSQAVTITIMSMLYQFVGYKLTIISKRSTDVSNLSSALPAKNQLLYSIQGNKDDIPTVV